MINADSQSRPVPLDQGTHTQESVRFSSFNVEFDQGNDLVAHGVVGTENHRLLIASRRYGTRRTKPARK
ncbi:MAG TPA: hypothetical protein VGC39_01420, partial [Candidatus Methylacidiphilales bacterium]